MVNMQQGFAQNLRMIPKRHPSITTIHSQFNIEGWASVFNVIDQQNDKITNDALFWNDKPLMLLEHDFMRPVGTWENLECLQQGLFVEGRLNNDLIDTSALISDITDERLYGLSIGYICKDCVMENSTRKIIKAEVIEISFVKQPANKDALLSKMTQNIERTRN